jgi:glucose-6-phosphate isomerase
MDPIAFNRIASKLNPETTLFIVSSKSFTTAETLYNLEKAQAWIKYPEAFERHFIAVTAYPARAQAFGIENVLPIWEWVGGRYSFCSAINLITCIAVGFELFSEILQGAHSMDEHFRHTPFIDNLPINLALLGIWNSNFLKIHQLLMLTYGHSLDYFAPYIQQLDMESNGKSIDTAGRAVNYTTGPIIWGGSGNRAQHSYYQLLCQGTHRIAVDLISIDTNQEIPVNHLCFAQKEVLTKGVYNPQEPNKAIPGNTPMNHIRLHDNTPKSLGALIALYEHKIYVQSVIWQINAFDQPAVESSKVIQKRRLIHGCI